jgi:TonB family protein
MSQLVLAGFCVFAGGVIAALGTLIIFTLKVKGSDSTMISRGAVRAFGLASLALMPASILLGCSGSNQQAADSLPQQNVPFGPGPKPIPYYPELAARNDWEGTVVLRVVVGSDCRASAVEVAQSSGHGILDDAAKECVRKWTFLPNEIGTNMETIRFNIMK